MVIGDILDDEGLRLEAEIRELGGQATFVHLDVTDADQWAGAVTEAVNRYGKLDILVNNAGIGSTNAGGINAPRIHEAPTEVWDQIMDVNSKGVFLGTRAAIAAMRTAGGGSIVNISSIAGLVGLGPGSARRRGLRQFQGVRCACSPRPPPSSTAGENIRCNSVHPGYIDTAMTERMMSDPELRQMRIDNTPVGRIGTVDDIAYGVLFLASDESSFMTGSELVIDGGYTAQ